MQTQTTFKRAALFTFALGATTALGMTVALPAAAEGNQGSRDHGKGSTHIAVDFDFNSALAAQDTKVGGGGALRLGQKYDLLLVSLTPELGGSYHAFAGNDDTRIYTGFLGGRFGVGKVIEPSVFAHLGVGRVEGLAARTAPVIDCGLAIDLTLLPLIDLGFHAGYNVMMPRGDGTALKYLTLGVQAALVF